MNRKCTLLMYHATPSHGEGLTGADPHYAVDLGVFRSHLDLLAQQGRRGACMASVVAGPQAGQPPAVGITFDDGHVSNLAAAQALADKGWSATFFVNTSTVGSPHFLSWAQLREMVAMGMAIQSHAHQHRYMQELSDAEQLDELTRSKAELESQLGQAVVAFAPPGGRTNARTRPLAQQAGYRMLGSSRVGLYRPAGDTPWDVPRFAVLAHTSLGQLRAWVEQSPGEIAQQVLRYQALHTVKRLLGNAGYERLRGALLSGSKGT